MSEQKQEPRKRYCEVKDCVSCPNRRISGTGRTHTCMISGGRRLTLTMGVFPSWCPLSEPRSRPHTPAPAAEYIIVPKELIDDIKTCLKYGCDGTLPNEGELLKALDEYSRPHTPAPAQEVCEEQDACRIPAMCPEVTKAAKAAREQVLPFVDLVTLMETKQREMNEIMRKHNLKIDNLDDPMQKLAFTFYSEIAEMAHKAEVVIKEYEESTQQQAGEQHE